MGTLLISKIREEYPDRIMNTFSVVPSPKVRAGFFQLTCMYRGELYDGQMSSYLHDCRLSHPRCLL